VENVFFRHNETGAKDVSGETKLDYTYTAALTKDKIKIKCQAKNTLGSSAWSDNVEITVSKYELLV
jgi:hypothetical protein